MKLLLVCGGQSTEHAVSRMSCVNIYKNCDKSKYDIKVAGITKEGEWYDLVSTDFSSDNWLEGATKINDHFTFLKSFDVVFPVLHGQFGEDGTIQGLLEMAQVPYVGCRVMASCTAMDKIYAKKLFDQANILVQNVISFSSLLFSFGLITTSPLINLLNVLSLIL